MPGCSGSIWHRRSISQTVASRRPTCRRGQRKRLAFIQAVLEDRPILMFDEWAADQDPEFRRLFYRRLLPELRDAGKTVIAVSHDDRYFDAADRIIHMARGQITRIEHNSAGGAEVRGPNRVDL